MAYVFVSYRSLNRMFAEQFASELRKFQHQVKGDLGGLIVTADYDARLINELTESNAVVFLFTADATGSENILAEAGAAKMLQNLTGRPHIIPVVFPGGHLPEPLARVWAQVYPETAPSPEALAERINSLLAKYPANIKARLPDSIAGDKITIPWLWEHVAVSYWMSLIGVVFAALLTTFTLGIRAAQIPWIESLFGEKGAAKVLQFDGKVAPKQ